MPSPPASFSPPRCIFHPILGDDWSRLPPVLRRHYDHHAYSQDSLTLHGWLDVSLQPWLGWLNRCTGMLVSRKGTRIPTTVILRASPETDHLHFHRTFHYPQGAQTFHSTMQPIGGNQFIEWMRLGLGWKLAYQWHDAQQTLTLQHRGYVWRLLRWHVPIPLHWLLGQGYAEEKAINDNCFAMWTACTHPLWGVTFRYAGEFTLPPSPQNSSSALPPAPNNAPLHSEPA